MKFLIFHSFENDIRPSVTKEDCEKTVQDRPTVCLDIEWECWVRISENTIFDIPALTSAKGVLFGCSQLAIGI